LRELVADRDRLELSLGDALDVKGSIVLVVITFLATLSGSLLESPGLGRYGRLGQLISIVALAVGGVLAVVSVWPRNYYFPDLPQKYERWIADLKAYYAQQPNQDSLVESTVTEGIVVQAMDRVTRNHKINGSKSRYLQWSFWFTLGSLAIDLVTLAAIGFSKALS
jgi:hypothetical protein